MAELRNDDARPDLTGARFAVAGLGASGRAALEVLSTLKIPVAGFDTNEAAVEAADGPVRHAATHEEFAERATRDVDVVVASPGIPPHSALYARAAERSVKVISEIELAWCLQAPLPGGGYAPWLTLTGTNGKTTTVQMTSAILSAAGLVAPAVGNVGTPAVLVAARGGVDVLAAELSSFQLHSTFSVRPLASACLNIDADHLDWHGSMAAYAADKGRVHAGAQAACLYSRHDARTEQVVRDADVQDGARAISVGVDSPPVAGLGLVEDVLVDRAYIEQRATSAQELATLADLAQLSAGESNLPPHIVADALFAAGLARAAGVAPQAVAAGLRSYSPGAHRIETIAELDAVRYINDSKATNAHAARASLSALAPGTVVWIAGGLAKGATFTDLVADVAGKLRAVVLIGADQRPLTQALEESAPGVLVHAIDPATDRVMAAAVAAARSLARPGDTVILAPACASMDQFANYAMRGDEFAKAVRESV